MIRRLAAAAVAGAASEQGETDQREDLEGAVCAHGDSFAFEGVGSLSRSPGGPSEQVVARWRKFGEGHAGGRGATMFCFCESGLLFPPAPVDLR